MKMERNNTKTKNLLLPSGRRVVRLISLSSLPLALLVGWLFVGTPDSCAFIRSTGIAVSILLLVPWGEENSFKAVLMASAVLIASVLLSVIGDSLGRDASFVLYWLLLTSPPVLRFIFTVKDLSKDRRIMRTQVQGWEMVQTFFNMGLALMAISWYGLAFFLAGAALHSAIKYTVLAISLFLYLFLFSRNLTRKEIAFVPPRSEKTEEYDIKTPSQAYHASNGRYRTIYRAMCDMLESKTPFLNPDYTVDDMARDLCTNRSYLSNMIKSCTAMNFPQLMNSYRVRYAQDLFKKDPRLKVIELSQMSGFGNTVSFGMAFRLFMDMPPRSWCEKYLDTLPQDQKKAILAKTKARVPRPPKKSSGQGGQKIP